MAERYLANWERFNRSAAVNLSVPFGGMINNDRLVIPYGISDRSSTFALVSLAELLAELIR